MPHSWPWTGAAPPCVEHCASNRLCAGQLTWCQVKDSSRYASSCRRTCQSRHATIGSWRTALKRRPPPDATTQGVRYPHRGHSRRHRLLDRLFRWSRCRHRLLERCDFDLSFRLGRAYVHCCLLESLRRRQPFCRYASNRKLAAKATEGGGRPTDTFSALRLLAAPQDLGLQSRTHRGRRSP